MARAQKSLSFRFHEIATPNKSARNDKVFLLRPKRKLIRSVLINGMCNFKDVTKPPTASLWSGLLMYTHSKGTYTRNVLIQSVLINGMCIFGVSVRKANAEISAEQDGCTRMRGTVLRKPPHRRSGITRGRYLSMRVPPVFPASDG